MIRRCLHLVSRHLEAKDLSARLGKILLAQGWTIATAESLTGGRVCHVISMTSGASRWLQGGDVAYNLDRKVDKLRIDRAHARGCDCVSPRVAAEMAAGAARRNRSQVSLATTGYAEAAPGVPKPTAWIAISINGHASTFQVTAPTAEISRTDMQDLVALQAIRSLINVLEGPDFQKV